MSATIVLIVILFGVFQVLSERIARQQAVADILRGSVLRVHLANV